jgi:hypothetical protein
VIKRTLSGSDGAVGAAGETLAALGATVATELEPGTEADAPGAFETLLELAIRGAAGSAVDGAACSLCDLPQPKEPTASASGQARRDEHRTRAMKLQG